MHPIKKTELIVTTGTGKDVYLIVLVMAHRGRLDLAMPCIIT